MNAYVLRYHREPEESLWSSLLKARNIENPGEFFSSASVEDLHDPFLFEDMEKAVERLLKAIHGTERIAVYGDYDVDGISGSALLLHTLRMLGAEVTYRVPHRRDEGYGLHKKYIDELAGQAVKVLITVDVGISCVLTINEAESRGIHVIITDHHAVPKNLPKAYAVLHPQLSKNYPFHHLSGSGVAFKLACALLQRTKNHDWIPILTDLASLGTVADCVPLLGENRTLVKLGLEQMKQTKWDGLRSILKHSGAWKKQNFSTHTIGFQIGPRLNASGRMESPYWALQALLAEGRAAQEKTQKLEVLNRERQALTEYVLEQAEARLNHREPLLIAEGPWSSGVVGLIAGRLQEKYTKPTFILEDRGSHLVGSARSLPGFHCVEAIKKAEALLETFGGHEQAAGFHLKKENYGAFKEILLSHAHEHFSAHPQKSETSVDLALQPEDLTVEHCEKITSFAPFGVANPNPLFLMDSVEISELRPVGKENQHLKLEGHFQGKFFEGIAFGAADRLVQLKTTQKLLGHLEKNDWNHRSTVQIRVVDF